MKCDILMVADSAQVAGDKLYLLGGAWRFLRAQKLPVNHSLAIAVGLLVDWMETNHRHQLKAELRSEDTKQRIVEVDAEFEQGRPPGFPAGMEQRVLMALNVTPRFESSGPYAVSLLVNGHEIASTTFVVIDSSKPLAGLSPAPETP